MIRKNVFEKFRTEGIKRVKVETLAGHNYLEQAEEMREEIRRINIANDRAIANANRVKMEKFDEER